MIDLEPLLKIRFDGKAFGSGKIPVSHLLRFLSNFDKAMQRTGRVLLGETESLRQGRYSRSIREEVALDLVLLTHGSPSAVLGFERQQIEQSFPDIDFGMEVLEKSINGLKMVQGREEALPEGFDAGVLRAWRDAGILFNRDVEHIEISLNHGNVPIVTHFTLNGYERIQERIKGPETNMRTIEGRLLMADFKEHGTRCRVHPSVGEPVLCLFDVEQKEDVLEDILHYVRIVGEAKEDPMTRRISSIKIHDIIRLEDQEDQAADLLPQGTPLSHNFWDSPSLEELAESQSVKPISDIQILFGTWPGEDDDEFEISVDEQRHHEITRE